MIVWRGWGILAVLVGLLGAGLGAKVGDLWGMAVGLVLAGVATWFLGEHFNKKAPEKKLVEWRAHREAELTHLVESGQFSLGPGQPVPTSVDEARSWSRQLLDNEELELGRRLRDRHQIFWLPMQYFAFLFGAAGVIVLVLAIVA